MFQRALRAVIALFVGGAVTVALTLALRLVLLAMKVDEGAFTVTLGAQLLGSGLQLVGAAVSGFFVARWKPSDWIVPALMIGAVPLVSGAIHLASAADRFWAVRATYAVACPLVVYLTALATSRRAEQALQPDASRAGR